MEIILSKQCAALTGSLGKGYGYYIRRARHQDGSVHFFSQRSKHPPIPHDGHLRFIFACAELAQMKTHITDILVSRKEFSNALWEAGQKQVSNIVLGDDDLPEVFDANDVLTLKRKWSL